MHYKDFFLPYYSNNFTSEEELYDFLSQLYPDSSFVSEQGSYYKSLLSLVLHICGPISLSALKVYLGDYLTSDSSRSKISRFAKKKLIASYKMVINDMNSRTLYAPTLELSSPVMSYTSNLQDELIKHKGTKAPLHNYGIGISLLNLMQLGIPMDYLNQNTYYSEYNHVPNLIVDSEIGFDDNHFWKIYLEQDMGTERSDVLYNKLVNYYHHTLFRNSRSYVVFSSHATIPFLDIPAFQMLPLQKLAAYMESSNCQNLQALYENYSNVLPPDVLIALMQLIQLTSRGYALSSNKKPLAIEKINENSTFVLRTAESPFTLQKLYKYIDDLKSGNNLYPLRLYIEKQYDLCNRKFRNLIDKIRVRRDSVFIGNLLNTVSVFFTPSMMLNNNYYFFAPEDSGYSKILHGILSNYIPYAHAATYQLVSPNFNAHDTREYYTIKFRNCFMYDNTVVACVEHISQDVAGYLRALYYARDYQEYGHDFALICVYDSKQDAFDFVERTECFPNSHKSKFKLLFLPSMYLSEKSKLYYVDKDADTGELLWKLQPYLK